MLRRRCSERKVNANSPGESSLTPLRLSTTFRRTEVLCFSLIMAAADFGEIYSDNRVGFCWSEISTSGSSK
jgi:hypothetical protein